MNMVYVTFLNAVFMVFWTFVNFTSIRHLSGQKKGNIRLRGVAHLCRNFKNCEKFSYHLEIWKSMENVAKTTTFNVDMEFLNRFFFYVVDQLRNNHKFKDFIRVLLDFLLLFD